MITDHQFIIFCGHGPNALGIVRSLHEAGLTPILFVSGEDSTCYADKSRYVGKVHYTPTCEEAMGLMIDLYANESHPPFVYTCTDAHAKVIDENYSRLIGKFYFFNCGEPGRLEALLNKDAQCRIAEEVGFIVPQREVVGRGQLPQHVEYPVITKTITSNEGAWKGDVYLCHNERELIEAYKKIKADTLLIEHYIDKKKEVVFQGISTRCGSRVKMPFLTEDTSFTDTAFGNIRLHLPCENHPLVWKINNLIRVMQFEGIFEIEFIQGQDERFYFLEINLRSSAVNYPYTFGGFNLPFLWALDTLEVPSEVHPESPFTSLNEIEE